VKAALTEAWPFWVDTHCHLDAPEFEPDRDRVVGRARQAGVGMLVLPAVRVADFDRVRALAHQHGFVYALGIHPLAVQASEDADLERLEAALQQHQQDPRLVAVGEVGLDGFVQGSDWPRQGVFLRRQLALAARYDLPVLLHVRRSVDAVLAALRKTPVPGGIAHAFNGSLQQARAATGLGLALGLGGSMSFDTALQIRRLASELPLQHLVLETDAPDIPPQWIYRTQSQRAQGQAQGRNEPAELPRLGGVLAQLRGLSEQEVRHHSTQAACVALPRLRPLLRSGGLSFPVAGADRSVPS
jgi:TatD DNase family protein